MRFRLNHEINHSCCIQFTPCLLGVNHPFEYLAVDLLGIEDIGGYGMACACVFVSLVCGLGFRGIHLLGMNLELLPFHGVGFPFIKELNPEQARKAQSIRTNMNITIYMIM